MNDPLISNDLQLSENTLILPFERSPGRIDG